MTSEKKSPKTGVKPAMVKKNCEWVRGWWRNSGVTPIKSWSNIWYQLSWRRSAFLAAHAQGKGLCSFQQGRMLKPSLFFVKNYNNPSPCACTRSCISNLWPIFEGVTTLWRKVATHWPSNQVTRGEGRWEV